MKKLILYSFILLFTLFFFKADAQNVALGVRGGLSIPNLTAGGSTENPLNEGYSSREGVDAGIFAEFKISDLFSIQPMLEYSSQGGKKDGFQALPTPPQLAPAFAPGPAPTYVGATYNSAAKLNYLMLPILAKFGWNFSKSSPFRVYVDAGPFLGYLVYAHQITTGSSEFYVYPVSPAGSPPQPYPFGTQSLNNDENIKDQLNTINFGFEGNVGFAYKLKKSSIFIEGGGNYGLLNIQKGTANGKNNAGAGTVDIGYSILL